MSILLINYKNNLRYRRTAKLQHKSATVLIKTI